MFQFVKWTVFALIFIKSSYARSALVDSDDVIVKRNDVPIIGILAQEISRHLDGHFPDQYNSYIAASYVKFVEGGGARVVPIWIGKERDYYASIMKNLNGVLFPGGATWFYDPHGYADAGEHIYRVAEEMNDQGYYMPIWGTCLGFELITWIDANRTEHRADCSSDKQPLPLDFTPDFRDSRMFKNAPNDIIEILTTEDVTANFHQFCTTEQNLTDFGLDANWRVMSTNEDWNGLRFISTLEHRHYPFYGVQFHPEKNIYEWVPNKNITHTPNAIRASQYFAQFFVDEARKSFNAFADRDEEDRHLIYNYPTTFTGLVRSIYMESYLFNSTDREYTPSFVARKLQRDPVSRKWHPIQK